MNPTPTVSDLCHFSLPASPVLRIGITGGIGSGKSYVCRQLEAAGHPVFYCDDVAKRIIRTDHEVMDALRKTVGPQVYDAEGRLVKSVLAAHLCRGPEQAHQVDAIVHPRVAGAFLAQANRMSESLSGTGDDSGLSLLSALPGGGASGFPAALTVEQLRGLPAGRVLFMECALLFETSFDRLVDRSVLVHVSQATQLSRLMARDGISETKAREWMALQLSEAEKLRRAHFVIDNE